ncbi:MAG: SprT family zinc-dependent metalloprotease [Nitrospirota bacterium]|jgi:predicted metal-dependent hydrolase
MSEIKIDKIIRSYRRTLGLEIRSDTTLVVRAPMNASMHLIEKVVHKKSAWIKRKQVEIKKRLEAIAPRGYVNGEGFLYLGNTHRLYIVDHSDEPLTFNGDFYLSGKYMEHARNIFIDWYRKQAHQKISERVSWYSSLAGLKYNKINITSAQKRWGSCSYKGNLSFSWRLIMAPLRVIDYVVVHELAHLEEKNHSKQFWKKVKTIFPDYIKCKAWLKENHHFLIT